jgi:hypothetical protein
MPRSQADKDFVLDRVVPHRLHALYALTMAVDLIAKKDRDDVGGFSLELNGKVAVRGSAAGVTNAWLEVGIVHGRALLEFLGLGEKDGALIERKGPRDTDWRLDDFDLPPVTRAQAINAYKGDAYEAEQSLVSIMVFANRAIAHITDLVDPERFGTNHLQIASRGIHELVVGHLYRPLGMAAPPFGFPKSKRHP